MSKEQSSYTQPERRTPPTSQLTYDRAYNDVAVMGILNTHVCAVESLGLPNNQFVTLVEADDS